MQEKDKGRVVLVLGGVRSGKSRFAQSLAERYPSVTFIATAERRDDAEMNAKIDRHRADRPAHWTTAEEPIALGAAITAATTELVLVDCLTLFGSNLLESPQAEPCLRSFYAALEAPSRDVILVSNEVGSGVVPAYALGRQFRDLVGEINQRVAALADVVVLMVAGLPLALKGSL